MEKRGLAEGMDPPIIQQNFKSTPVRSQEGWQAQTVHRLSAPEQRDQNTSTPLTDAITRQSIAQESILPHADQREGTVAYRISDANRTIGIIAANNQIILHVGSIP